jgi:hypothetical protein
MIRNHQHHHGTGDHHNAAAELLARSFQLAVSAHDWVVAESLVQFFFADAHRLNDALCIALDSIWFLRYTQDFLHSPPPGIMCVQVVWDLRSLWNINMTVTCIDHVIEG